MRLNKIPVDTLGNNLTVACSSLFVSDCKILKLEKLEASNTNPIV